MIPYAGNHVLRGSIGSCIVEITQGIGQGCDYRHDPEMNYMEEFPLCAFGFLLDIAPKSDPPERCRCLETLDTRFGGTARCPIHALTIWQ
jgi:hypothetical protein